jgi:hypothetical protein
VVLVTVALERKSIFDEQMLELFPLDSVVAACCAGSLEPSFPYPTEYGSRCDGTELSGLPRGEPIALLLFHYTSLVRLLWKQSLNAQT